MLWMTNRSWTHKPDDEPRRGRQPLGLCLAAVVLGVVVLGALALPSGAAPGLFEDRAPTCVDAPLVAADAQVYWRWIGVLDDARNPCSLGGLPQGWVGRRLFDASARGLWPSLEPFCVYEHDGTSNLSQDDLVVLDGLDGSYDQFQPLPTLSTARRAGGETSTDSSEPPLLRAVAADAAAVAPAGSLQEALRPQLAKFFDEQAGRVEDLAPSFDGPSVRLSLLDTSPTGGAEVEASDHGRTLRLLAERLLCANTGDCLVSIHPRLAMAYRAIDPLERSLSPRDPDEGGFVGLLGELAESVVDELLHWRADADETDRLVLNLSLAWDPLYGGADPKQPVDEMSPPIAAVYRALEVAARDERVVTVAAAGNRADRHPSHAPGSALLPAAWTERSVESGAGERPLVVAVAGVDRRGRPLANAIAHDMPEWSAYGDHATVPTLSDEPPPGVLTGSSVAALVVSSTLAGVAAYRGDLGAAEVVDRVFAGSPAISGAAALCLANQTGSCQDQRLIRFCDAVETACADAPGRCPALAPCTVRSSALASLGGLPSLPGLDVGGWEQFDSECAAACGSVDLHWSPMQSQPESICPDRQHHAAARAPYSTPQPQSALCPTCPYRASSGTFSAEIDSDGRTLGSPTLELTCSGHRLSFALVAPSGGALTDGSQLEVTSLPADCSEAIFTYTLDTGPVGSGTPPLSATEPVLIVE